MMKTRGARYFSNYLGPAVGGPPGLVSSWVNLLFQPCSTRPKRNRAFHAIRAISFDGLPAFNLIRIPHPWRFSMSWDMCAWCDFQMPCLHAPKMLLVLLPHCWLVKKCCCIIHIQTLWCARSALENLHVSNSLRVAVKSRQCWSRTHSHNFITSQHTKSHYLATGEGGRSFFLNSPAASSLFNRILNSNGVENFIMAVPPAAVPAHPCARSLHLHNHLNRALAPPFKTAAPASLSRCVCGWNLSRVQTRTQSSLLFAHFEVSNSKRFQHLFAFTKCTSREFKRKALCALKI